MRKAVIALFIIAIVLQFSCEPPGKQQTVAPPAPQYNDPHPVPADAMEIKVTGEHGGRLISIVLADPKTFHQLIHSEADTQTYNELMAAGLTKLNNQTQEVEPALAKS